MLELTLDESSSFSLRAEASTNDCYIDDLLISAESLEEARKLGDEILELASRGGLKSTQMDIKSSGSSRRLSLKGKEAKVKLDSDKTIQSLGVCWNSKRRYLDLRGK